MTVQPPSTAPAPPQPIARDIIGVLADLWPRCFALYERRRAVPLKVGIRADIVAAAAGAITPEEIRTALRSYCRSVGYLLACQEGAARIDLNGEPAGFVSAGEAVNAAQLLAYKRSKQLAAANSSTATIPAPTVNTAPRRLSLDDLRAAAAERRRLGALP